MSAYRKYMFDLDFDRPAGWVEPPQPVEEAEPEVVEDVPPPPTFTEEELGFAREAAFEEGRQAGLKEAKQQAERVVANTLTNLANQMQALFRQQEEAQDEHQRAAARVAMAVLKKMLPAACEAHAFTEVTRVVEELVGHLLDEPRIIVKVAAPLVDPLRERLEGTCASHGFEGRLVVQADPRLAPGDCRVEWTDGGAERDMARLMEDIEATVERSLAPPERRADHDEPEFAGT